MKQYIEPVRQLEAMQVPDFSNMKASKDIEEECRLVASWLDEKGATEIDWEAGKGYFWFTLGTVRYQGLKNQWIVFNGSCFVFLSMSTFETLFEEVA